MKRLKTATVVIALALPAAAGALEFQTPGTLGMGRAGVARTTDAYATFINPAGLAFHEKGFSTKLNVDLGLALSSGLANNIDKAGKLDLKSSSLNYDPATATAAQVAAATAKAAQFANVLTGLKQDGGDFAVNLDLALGIQISSFGVGVLGITDLGASIDKDKVDLFNVRPGSTVSGANVNTLATDMGITITDTTPVPRTANLFNATQYSQITAAFQKAGASAVTAQSMTNTLEATYAAPGGNKTGMTTDQLVAGLVATAGFIDPTKGPIDNNTTTVVLQGIMIAEVPLAYGYKFDLGNFGKLGVGGAAKVMRGTVYSSTVSIKEFKDSQNAADKVKDLHTESTKFGLDLGALWRLEEVKYIGPINVGLALKNLNSPSFDGPKDAAGNSHNIKVKPQARLGLALDPLSWLSIAADMDLTKNNTAVLGRDSQLIGGGLEAHFDHWYTLWLALRAGAYKNLAESSSKPILTAGLSLGPQYIRLDINGAIATAKGTFDNKSVPLEGKVEFGLSTTFF